MFRFWPLWVLLLGGLLIWGMQRPDPKLLDSVLVGRQAPTFSLPVMEPFRAEFGPELGVHENLDKPVVLNIWASWCLPCRVEAPILERFHRLYGDRVLILGVNVQDTSANALAFVREFSLTFPSVYDKRGRIGIEYGFHGVPETFIIDRNGTILVRHAGEISAEQLQGYIRRVLQ